MNLLPKSISEFNDVQYWDEFFRKRDTKSFEWYGEFEQLFPLLSKYVRVNDSILVPGCGNSTLSVNLWRLGYRKLESIDISGTVVRQMQQQHSTAGLVFRQMDLKSLQYDSGRFSCVIDKATLDAIFCDNQPNVVAQVDTVLQEIGRVLRVGGRYLCVSLLQPHIARYLLSWFSSRGWLVRVCRCRKAEAAISDSVLYPVYVVVCTKFCPTDSSIKQPIIEACLNDESRPVRVDSTDTLCRLIADQQRYASLSHSARRRHCAGDVTVELCSPTNQQTRYTLHVVDRWHRKTKKSFAIFIVPHGRESEWLFGSADGQLQLAASLEHDRLLLVHLHRDQLYESLAAVHAELAPVVLDFRPAHLPDGVQVPFLTCGDDLGRRHVLHRGHSSESGHFIVEQVALTNSNTSSSSNNNNTSSSSNNNNNSSSSSNTVWLRRLVFLANRNVIQSEAVCVPPASPPPLSPPPIDSGKHTDVSQLDASSWPVDTGYLCCHHHRYMALAGAVIEGATRVSKEGAAVAAKRMLVVGIGGGCLVNFMRNKFPQWTIDAVDIDAAVVQVARDWFGFVTERSGPVTVHIADGLRYVGRCVESGVDYDLIMLDVDSKDASQSMSGPPVAFVEPDFLNSVKTLLSKRQGLLTLNLAARDTTARAGVLATLCATFAACAVYQLVDEVNQVVYCHVTGSTGDPAAAAGGAAAATATGSAASTATAGGGGTSLAELYRSACCAIVAASDSAARHHSSQKRRQRRHNNSSASSSEQFIDTAQFMANIEFL